MDFFHQSGIPISVGSQYFYPLNEFSIIMKINYDDLYAHVVESDLYRPSLDYEYGVKLKRKYMNFEDYLYVCGSVLLSIIFFRKTKSYHGWSKYLWRSDPLSKFRIDLENILLHIPSKHALLHTEPPTPLHTCGSEETKKMTLFLTLENLMRIYLVHFKFQTSCFRMAQYHIISKRI